MPGSTKAKYDEEWMKGHLAQIYAPHELTYWQLMEEHRTAIIKAKQQLPLEREKLDAVIKLALIRQIQSLAKTEPVTSKHIQAEHPELDHACRNLYKSHAEKSCWTQFLEEAGLGEYCPKKPVPIKPKIIEKKWGLRQIIEEMDKLNPEELIMNRVKETRGDFVEGSKRAVRSFGRAAIVSGINYLEFCGPCADKTVYSFGEEETINLATEPTLKKKMRTRLLFNIFGLQHYYFDCGFSRIIDGNQAHDYDNCCQSDMHLDGGIQTRREQNPRHPGLVRILLTLNPYIENRVHQAGLYFKGSEAITLSSRLYTQIKRVIDITNSRIAERLANQE